MARYRTGGAALLKHLYQDSRSTALKHLPRLLQLCPATYELAPAGAGFRDDQRQWLGEGVAAVYAGDGRWIDRPRVDAARSADVSGATVAATSCSVKSGWGDDREAGQDWC